MGSTTWEDPHMPRPLPKRINVLATSRKDDYPGADDYINGDLVEQVDLLQKKYLDKEIWIIGGPKIIEQTLDIIDEFYLSSIPGAYACDTFLPIDSIQEKFTEIWKEDHLEVTFKIYEKRK
jgi:dihydrofolate reductase